MLSPEVFAMLAAAGSIVSFIINAYAAFKTKYLAWTNMFIITAILSLFYSVAWISLILPHDFSRQEWSEVVTPVSVVTFFTVWIGAPILMLLSTERDDSE